MSAIHGIDNIWAMGGPRFFAWAYRLSAYQGVMRALAERQAMQEEKRTGGRQVVEVGSGELSKIESLGGGLTSNNGDGAVWLSLEKATD